MKNYISNFGALHLQTRYSTNLIKPRQGLAESQESTDDVKERQHPPHMRYSVISKPHYLLVTVVNKILQHPAVPNLNLWSNRNKRGWICKTYSILQIFGPLGMTLHWPAFNPSHPSHCCTHIVFRSEKSSPPECSVTTQATLARTWYWKGSLKKRLKTKYPKIYSLGWQKKCVYDECSLKKLKMMSFFSFHF